MFQQGNRFLTLQHVLLGNGQGQQADVADEGAPGLGSGEWCFRRQRVVGLDHQVHSQQHQAQGEQGLRGKTGTELITLQELRCPHTRPRLLLVSQGRGCAPQHEHSYFCCVSWFSCDAIYVHRVVTQFYY